MIVLKKSQVGAPESLTAFRSDIQFKSYKRLKYPHTLRDTIRYRYKNIILRVFKKLPKISKRGDHMKS